MRAFVVKRRGRNNRCRRRRTIRVIFNAPRGWRWSFLSTPYGARSLSQTPPQIQCLNSNTMSYLLNIVNDPLPAFCAQSPDRECVVREGELSTKPHETARKKPHGLRVFRVISSCDFVDGS